MFDEPLHLIFELHLLLILELLCVHGLLVEHPVVFFEHWQLEQALMLRCQVLLLLAIAVHLLFHLTQCKPSLQFGFEEPHSLLQLKVALPQNLVLCFVGVRSRVLVHLQPPFELQTQLLLLLVVVL